MFAVRGWRRPILIASLAATPGVTGVGPANWRVSSVIEASRIPDSSSVRPLKVVEVKPAVPGDWLALFMSGDGGWVTADRRLADSLASEGVGVLGLDSRAYLGTHPTPAQASADVAATLRSYLAAWGRKAVVLIGSSRGADLVPFIANRLPDSLRASVKLIAMFGLGRWASFEFHWSDLVLDTHRPTDLPVLPELERLRGTRMLCVYGSDERNSLCRSVDTTLVQSISRDGGHRLRGDQSGALARLILDALPSRTDAGPDE